MCVCVTVFFFLFWLGWVRGREEERKEGIFVVLSKRLCCLVLFCVCGGGEE